MATQEGANVDTSRHTGKVALITGAGSGIGRATAVRLAQEGAQVVGCDLNEAGLVATLEAIKSAGKNALMLAGDITKQADVDRVVDETLGAHGQIDILGNVAGIMDWFLPAHEVDDETWNRVMAVNVTGPMILSRKVLPAMMARSSGAIVNIASVGGLGGGAAGAAYTTSKHAIIGLTRSISWTYGTEGIRCNAICPGGVDTNIGTTARPRSQWGMDKLAPWQKLGRASVAPDEIAALLSWLASDEAKNVNGAVVTSDGGWTSA